MYTINRVRKGETRGRYFVGFDENTAPVFKNSSELTLDDHYHGLSIAEFETFQDANRAVQVVLFACEIHGLNEDIDIFTD